MIIDPKLLAILRCPISGAPLQEMGRQLVAGDQRYDVVNGIPLLIPQIAESTHSGFDDLMADNLRAAVETRDLDAFIDGMIVPTCGNLFNGAKLRGRYPIPDFPRDLSPGHTLDLGCNWGRWSIAGAMAGHSMVGVDIHLEGLLVAQQIAAKLIPNNMPFFVVADARHLPFADETFDGTFSYSVVQHFSRENAAVILGEMGRTLKAGGVSKVQMPNVGGIKARATMGRSRFSDGGAFDVRYYSIDQLIGLFNERIGRSSWSVDCFLGLNVHAKDLPLVRPTRRPVIYAAEVLRALGNLLPAVQRLADSVWIKSRKASSTRHTILSSPPKRRHR